MDKTKVILIGGINGSGKTTIAKKLGEKLNIPHCIGLGFMRESIKGFISKKKEPLLYSHSFKAHEITGGTIEYGFRAQTKLLSKAVNACINRAKKEGTGLIIEGTQLLPEFIPKDTFMIILIPDTKCDHYKRIHGKDTHSKRKVSPSEYKNIKQLEKYLVKQAKKYTTPIIINKDVDETVKQIVKMWVDKNDS